MSSTNNRQPTMQDLVASVSDLKTLEVGQTVQGVLIFVSKNQVMINIPNVGIGIVRGRELYNEAYLSRLKLGENIEAMVIDLDNEQGYIELSFREIGREEVWKEVNEMFEAGTTVKAKIREVNRGGFLVKVNGVDGFLPASLLAPSHAIKSIGGDDKSLGSQMRKYIGQSFDVKIVNVNIENESVIVSEKAVFDEQLQAKLAKFKQGDVVDTEIIGIVDFGLFIKFDDGLDGLIHISEIAWKKVDDPRSEYKIGDKVKAKIIEISNDGRVNLSIKQTQTNPWLAFIKNTSNGDEFEATVTKIVSYGLIVVNKDDVQGLCHISQISETELSSAADIHKLYKVGDKATFKVLHADADSYKEGRLYLTLLVDNFALAEKRQAKLLDEEKARQESTASQEKDNEEVENSASDEDEN